MKNQKQVKKKKDWRMYSFFNDYILTFLLLYPFSNLFFFFVITFFFFNKNEIAQEFQ